MKVSTSVSAPTEPSLGNRWACTQSGQWSIKALPVRGEMQKPSNLVQAGEFPSKAAATRRELEVKGWKSAVKIRELIGR